MLKDVLAYSNYVASYELQKIEDLSKPQNKHHKNVIHCFILNEEELWFLNFSHFRKGHLVIEMPLNIVTKQWLKSSKKLNSIFTFLLITF